MFAMRTYFIKIEITLTYIIYNIILFMLYTSNIIPFAFHYIVIPIYTDDEVVINIPGDYISIIILD